MDFTTKIKNYIKSHFPSFDYNEILITERVIGNIIDLAKQAHPKEFIILLRGDIKNKKLTITSLIYQTYQASENASAIKINLPLVSNVYGSCHGHPGYSNKPSAQDLRFFNKYPGVHLIICRPYNVESVKAYDTNGNEVGFRIV